MLPGALPKLLVIAIVALLLIVSGGPSPSVHAETDGSVAIGCEFLAAAIDGDMNDVTSIGDFIDGCDGVDGADVANLAVALGDKDSALEATDFAAIDVDANQIQDGGAGVADEIVMFAFVDNDGTVYFDATVGVTVAIHDDGGLDDQPPGDDANAETCDGDDDMDCGTSVLNNGDGVAVATISDSTADMGDTVDVDMFQADDTSNIQVQTINVVGQPDNVTIEALESAIQVSGDSTDVDDCVQGSDVTDGGQLADLNRTFVKATVTDLQDSELTRIGVVFVSNDDDIATLDDDLGEISSDPKAATGISVDAGAAGIGAFAVICGGTTTGSAFITATEQVNGNDADVAISVVGLPANVSLVASPAEIQCGTSQASTVSAYVTDADGNPAADGTSVNFSVVALGAANPVNAETVGGVASSQITAVAGATAGVTVIVTAGDAQASIRIDCAAPPCADVTGDGRVTGRDVALIRKALRTGDHSYDITGDGLVTFEDLARAIAERGTTCATSPPQN